MIAVCLLCSSVDGVLRQDMPAAEATDNLALDESVLT
jgi:hypothetical protein